jgi:CRP-like cAMP-binding protein
MPDRGFFAFCTSLNLIELKAIGQLSRVKHFDEDQIVYRPGDPGDEIYIINRGVVAMGGDQFSVDRTDAYLSRGDIFGNLEALAGQQRNHSIRTCEPSSLQSFQSKDFPDLVRRVPAFFHYLCEQMAHRLLRAHEMALDRSHCLELSGNLSNFDLITVYQTILNSARTGVLRIFDDTGEPIAVFSFERGRPCRGRFHHLTGGEAFWQLFQEEALSGTFSLSSGNKSTDDEIPSEKIEHNYSEMLLTAVHFRDELCALKEQIPARTTSVRRQKLNFDWPASAPTYLQPLAEQIWQLAYSAPITLSNLFQKCSVCQLKIYQVVSTLIQSGHFNSASSGVEATAVVATN